MEKKRESRNKPPIYGQLIYDKGYKICNAEKRVSLISGTGKSGQVHVKEQE